MKYITDDHRRRLQQAIIERVTETAAADGQQVYLDALIDVDDEELTIREAARRLAPNDPPPAAAIAQHNEKIDQRTELHNCEQHAIPYTSDGPLGHGWECGQCGRFLQAG